MTVIQVPGIAKLWSSAFVLGNTALPGLFLDPPSCYSPHPSPLPQRPMTPPGGSWGLTFGAGPARGRVSGGLGTVGLRMGVPQGLGRFLRPGTGLAGSAFWGGRGLEKSWKENSECHSEASILLERKCSPYIEGQNQMRKGCATWCHLKTNRAGV